MAQFLQLAQRVRQETGTAGTGPVTVLNQKAQLAQIVSWTAQAYMDVCNKWHDMDFFWAEGEVTVSANTRDYTPPNDMRLLNEDSVYLFGGDISENGLKLDYVEYDVYRRNKTFNDNSSTPSYFTQLPNGVIRLLPTPDENYSLHFEYWKAPLPLTENTSLPVFHEAHDDCIIWRACWYWAMFNEAIQEAAAFNYSFEQAMLRLESRYLPASQGYHARSQGVELVVRTE